MIKFKTHYRFKPFSILAIACLSLLLSSCDKETPKCYDRETTDLVKKIFHERLIEYVRMRHIIPADKVKEFLKNEATRKTYPMLFATYKVKNIRTVDFNKETGAYTCKATVNSLNKEANVNHDSEVNYLVELSDNGKEFYVTLEIN